jgi:hypothetical protein
MTEVDNNLLMDMYTKVALNTQILERVEKHQKKTNGAIEAIQEKQFRQDGAFDIIKWGTPAFFLAVSVLISLKEVL